MHTISITVCPFLSMGRAVFRRHPGHLAAGPIPHLNLSAGLHERSLVLELTMVFQSFREHRFRPKG